MPFELIYYFISLWFVYWRRRVGIEPTNDCFRAIHAGLKSGAPTSDASVSVEGNMQKALINVQQGERNHR